MGMNTPIRRVGLVAKHNLDASAGVLAELAGWLEARGVEPAAQRHELVFSAAAHQRGHDFQDASVRHRECCSIARAWTISARQVFLRATARPATLKK